MNTFKLKMYFLAERHSGHCFINGQFAEPEGTPDSHERVQPSHAPVEKMP
jgi:hypothetical protein